MDVTRPTSYRTHRSPYDYLRALASIPDHPILVHSAGGDHASSRHRKALSKCDAWKGQAVGQGCAISCGNSSWWGTFAKSLFTTNPFPTALKSFGEGGCNQILAETFAEDISPIPLGNSPGVGDAVDAASKFASQTAYAAALTHAASATNVLGGQGLLYPFKSSIFSGLMGASKVAEEAAIPATLVLATAHAVYSSGAAALKGQCY